MLCTDPIGECLSIAEKLDEEGNEDGEWYYFNSHEIGVILLDFLVK